MTKNIRLYCYIILIIFSLSFAKDKQADSDKLKFVYNIFRHGARTPLKRYSSDNTRDVFNQEWRGVQELTAVGKRQHYLLGARNRKYFIEQEQFLSKSFDPKEIYIYSTNINRTLDSVAAHMQGFFPNGTGSVLNEAQINFAKPPVEENMYKDALDMLGMNSLPFNSDVIPIHVIEESSNMNNLYNEDICKGLNGSKAAYRSNPKVLNKINDFNKNYNAAKMAKLTRKDAGVTENCFKEYKCTSDVLDTIVSLYYDGRDINDIRSALEISNITNFIQECFDFFYYDLPGTLEETRNNTIYGMSKFFHSIIHYMEMRIEKDKTDENYVNYDIPKYVIYSAHDSTVGAFEAIMKYAFKTDILYTPFASSIWVELYKRESGTYYVKYKYNTEKESFFEFDDFKKKLNDVIVSYEEVDKFCFPKEEVKPEVNYSKGVVATIVILSLVIVLLLVFLIIVIRRKKGDNNKIFLSNE